MVGSSVCDIWVAGDIYWKSRLYAARNERSYASRYNRRSGIYRKVGVWLSHDNRKLRTREQIPEYNII